MPKIFYYIVTIYALYYIVLIAFDLFNSSRLPSSANQNSESYQVSSETEKTTVVGNQNRSEIERRPVQQNGMDQVQASQKKKE